MPEKNLDNDRDFAGKDSPEADDVSSSAVPPGMTLEHIIDLTGELEHLNELIMLQLKKQVDLPAQNRIFAQYSRFWICLKLRSGSDIIPE
jgi:hypothetical protein